MSITLLSGDCRDVLPTLAANSVHTCVTSPPYFGLRDYGTAQWDGGDAACDHARPVSPQRDNSGGLVNNRLDTRGSQSWSDGTSTAQFRDTCGKCGARRVDRQIGLEATPDEYLVTMVAVFREVRRVLRPDGTAFVNMGDGYRDKQLQMIPARLALALQADGWFLRSDIIWAKPNPMPESVTDRPTSAHEHVFLLTRSPRYFYDAEAVREQSVYGPGEGGHQRFGAPGGKAEAVYQERVSGEIWNSNGSRNCRNVWTIATHAYPQAHFATFPPELAERCIRAGTSERGCCAACGAPWRRTTDTHYTEGGPNHTGNATSLRYIADGERTSMPYKTKHTTTTGWSASCACAADVVPATVLDVFAGAGTTLLVADRLQRNAVGIELNASYTTMAMERVRADAPLFVDTPEPQPVPGFAQPDLFAEAAD